MHFHYTPYLWLLAVSSAVIAILMVYAWRHRTVLGAAPFAATMLLVTICTVGNALEVAGADLPTKSFWANVQYLGYAGTPVGWLVLALQFTGRGHWLTRRRLAVLAIIPLITQVVVWTNDLHGLMRHHIYLDTSGPFPAVGKMYGHWYWVHFAYGYACLFLSVFFLAQMLPRVPWLHRRQIQALLIGLILPILANVSYIFRLNPIRWMDLTPVMFGVAGVIVAWGLFRWWLFDIVPVARSMVIESMGDGVLLLDGQDRIVDLNSAAQGIIGRPAEEAVGRAAAEVLETWPGLSELCCRTPPAHAELATGTGRFYDARLLPLADAHGRPVGRLLVLRDTTKRRQAQARLLEQQRALAMLKERERLARELHDNLSQVLAYLNVQAQAIRQQLAKGQVAVADAALARLVTVAQEAHADVRACIHDARTAATTGGLLAALCQCLERFARDYDLPIELTGADALAGIDLEPSVEVQLVHIIQEALHNVRKHAAARHVRVAIVIWDDELEIAVEDDGRGLDPAVGEEHGFGLRIMRERAAEAGGSLELISAPGRGTRVAVRVPFRKEGAG